jgi:hypothetical protein
MRIVELGIFAMSHVAGVHAPFAGGQTAEFTQSRDHLLRWNGPGFAERRDLIGKPRLLRTRGDRHDEPHRTDKAGQRPAKASRSVHLTIPSLYSPLEAKVRSARARPHLFIILVA